MLGKVWDIQKTHFENFCELDCFVCVWQHYICITRKLAKSVFKLA